jgi:hypothetical protein
MATCELWVKGTAENGGVVAVDVLVTAGWSSSSPMPTLTVIATGNGAGGVYTRYAASPAWQYNPAGWYSYPQFYLKNCTGIDPTQKHDCVNGGCVPQSTYNTPGVYANLATCQSGCAKNSTCTGECVSAADLAALQQAAGTVQTRICGS